LQPQFAATTLVGEPNRAEVVLPALCNSALRLQDASREAAVDVTAMTLSEPYGPCGESVNGRALEIIGQLARERSLTGREYEVLAATARGESTKQIGYALGISANTVAYYWAQIFRKLGCRSQIEVMALLFRRATATGSIQPVLVNAPTVLNSPPTTLGNGVGNETR
jgi:DNA-binding CsgD family transcriptional regulator